MKDSFLLNGNYIEPFTRFMAFLFEYKDIEYNFSNISIITLLDAQYDHPAQELSQKKFFMQSYKEKYTFYDAILATEYIEDVIRYKPVISGNIIDRLDQKHVTKILLNDFFKRVIIYILEYKIKNNSTIGNNIIIKRINGFLDYAQTILSCHDGRYISTYNNLSISDIALLANLSILEYVGYYHVKTSPYLELNQWYLRMKSEKKFRKIIQSKSYEIFPSKGFDEVDY